MSEETYNRFRVWRTCTTLTGYLSVVMASMGMTWPSPLTAWYSSQDSEVPMTEHEVSWVVSLSAIGACISSIPCGMFADRFGRKTILLFTGIASTIGWLLVMLTRNKWALYAAQVLQGIVLGGAPSVVPIYLSEISPPNIRGAIVGQVNTVFYVGHLLVYTVGPQLSYTNYIRFCASIPILFLIFFGFAPETPYYLLSKGRDEEARECMLKLRGEKFVEELEASKKESLENKSTDKDSIWELLKTNNYMKHMIFLQILSFVGMFIGASSVSVYAVEFMGGQWVAVAMGVVFVVSSFLAAFLADPIGRRPLLVSSLIGTAISTALLAAHFIYHEKILLYLGLFGFCFITSVGINPFIMTLPSELFPTSLRAFANGLTQSTTAFFGFICIKIFVNIKDILGVEYNFVLYTFCALIGTVPAYLLPETAKTIISAA